MFSFLFWSTFNLIRYNTPHKWSKQPWFSIICDISFILPADVNTHQWLRDCEGPTDEAQKMHMNCIRGTSSPAYYFRTSHRWWFLKWTRWSQWHMNRSRCIKLCVIVPYNWSLSEGACRMGRPHPVIKWHYIVAETLHKYMITFIFGLLPFNYFSRCVLLHAHHFLCMAAFMSHSLIYSMSILESRSKRLLIFLHLDIFSDCAGRRIAHRRTHLHLFEYLKWRVSGEVSDVYSVPWMQKYPCAQYGESEYFYAFAHFPIQPICHLSE